MQHTLLSAFLLLGMSCHSAGARLGRASRELMGIATVPKTVAAPIPAPGSQAVYGPVPEAFSVPAREAVPAPLRKTTPAPVPTPMFAALPGRASVPVPAPTIAALPGRATAPVPSDHMGHVSLVPGRAPAQVPSDHMGPVSLVPGRAPAPVPSGDLTGPVSLVPGGIGGTVPLPSPTSQLPGSAPSPGRAQQASALQWPGLSDPGSAGRLEYHGGPLLTGTITVYVIYYGNWPENAGQFVLEGFVNSLSSTEADDQGPSVRRWWEIATKYTDSSGTPVASQVVYGGAVTIGGAPGSYSTQLGDGFDSTTNDDIKPLVEQVISGNYFPLDPHALYVVLTSGDVRVGSDSSGFCGAYCGWHNEATIQDNPARYALVGDPTQQCPNACGHTTDFGETPNGFPSVDSLMSVFAHELVEAATNPDTASGYFARPNSPDGETQENADLCNGVFTDEAHPSTLTNEGNTYQYNLLGVNGLRYLVQTNADLETQSCILQA